VARAGPTVQAIAIATVAKTRLAVLRGRTEFDRTFM
jgi:type IV secretory pathway VirB2 component (pilin)